MSSEENKKYIISTNDLFMMNIYYWSFTQCRRETLENASKRFSKWM